MVMGLMVSSKFVEKLQILKVPVIPKVTKCGLELRGRATLPLQGHHCHSGAIQSARKETAPLA